MLYKNMVVMNNNHNNFKRLPRPLLVALVSVFFSADLFAATNVSQYNHAWEGNYTTFTDNEISGYCTGHASNLLDGFSYDDSTTNTNACIDTSNGTTYNCAPEAWQRRRPQEGDEHYIDMVIATNVHEHGAYFCPARIVTLNTESVDTQARRPWLDWTEISVTNQNCMWLCQAGWTGDDCQTAVDSNYIPQQPEQSSLTPDLYRNVTFDTSNGAFTQNIPVFTDTVFSEICVGGDSDHFKFCTQYYPNTVNCSDYENHKITTEEYDKILAIVGWLDSGNGAFVRQIIVRSTGIIDNNWCEPGAMCSYPFLYPAMGSKPILVCKPDYRPNDEKTDCIKIVNTVCTENTNPDLCQTCPKISNYTQLGLTSNQVTDSPSCVITESDEQQELIHDDVNATYKYKGIHMGSHCELSSYGYYENYECDYQYSGKEYTSVPAGYGVVNNNTVNATVQQCTGNTYSTTSMLTCDAVPAGSSPNPDHSGWICNSYSTQNENTCLCDSGYYFSDSDDRCNQCPSYTGATISTNPNATSISDCYFRAEDVLQQTTDDYGTYELVGVCSAQQETEP